MKTQAHGEEDRKAAAKLKIRKRHELPPDIVAGPTRAEVKEATRTEGVRMGEFDLDRVESGGKGEPSFAVMVDSNGKEHNIELEHGQKRPSKAQLRELKQRLARRSRSVARGEAFRQRALKRKRRHTEETGTSSEKLR